MTDHPTASAIPQVQLALITGSSSWGLAFPEDIGVEGVRVLARDLCFETPYGQSDNWKLLEFDAALTAEGRSKLALCMYSHGNPRDRIDHSCHQRAFWVLREAGVKRVLSSSTIGAVNKAIQPGDLVLTMGTGYYEGEGAISAAIGYLSETGGIGYSAGIGVPLGGDGPVLRAGVSLKLN